MLEPYNVRSREFGLASFQDVKKALMSTGTVVLDARTPNEVRAFGTLDSAIQIRTCTASHCKELSTDPESYVPNKASTIVVFCQNGRRAAKAKQILLEHGYTGPILNAGGWYDVLEALAW
jgi:rhodanese-related sulfurtransferase